MTVAKGYPGAKIGHVGKAVPGVEVKIHDPNPEGVEPRMPSTDGRKPRVFILVSPDDSADRIMETAERLGAEVLWRNHYWSEFNGFNDAFRDPWGNEIVLWTKGGENPKIPDHFTNE